MNYQKAIEKLLRQAGEELTGTAYENLIRNLQVDLRAIVTNAGWNLKECEDDYELGWPEDLDDEIWFSDDDDEDFPD